MVNSSLFRSQDIFDSCGHLSNEYSSRIGNGIAYLCNVDIHNHITISALKKPLDFKKLY